MTTWRRLPTRTTSPSQSSCSPSQRCSQTSPSRTLTGRTTMCRLWTLCCRTSRRTLTNRWKNTTQKLRQALNHVAGKPEVDAGQSGWGECGGEGSDLKTLSQDHRWGAWIHPLVWTLCKSLAISDFEWLNNFKGLTPGWNSTWPPFPRWTMNTSNITWDAFSQSQQPLSMHQIEKNLAHGQFLSKYVAK